VCVLNIGLSMLLVIDHGSSNLRSGNLILV
jgi:hypothetical protein